MVETSEEILLEFTKQMLFENLTQLGKLLISWFIT